MGFEPTLEFPLNTLSKRAPSATRPSLRRVVCLLESTIVRRYRLDRIASRGDRLRTMADYPASSHHPDARSEIVYFARRLIYSFALLAAIARFRTSALCNLRKRNSPMPDLSRRESASVPELHFRLLHLWRARPGDAPRRCWPAIQDTGSAEALAAVAPREQLLFDFGWKFSSATAPIRRGILGFGYGQGDFAKTGDFEFAKAKFDDSKWRTLNLPHDWAVELPFVRDEEQKSHGYKPLGRRYPETSVGWYRREFEIPASDAGTAHRGRVRWRVPRRAGLREWLLHRPQRQRLCALPLRPDGLSALSARRTTLWRAWTPALATDGFTRARASIAMCG